MSFLTRPAESEVGRAVPCPCPALSSELGECTHLSLPGPCMSVPSLFALFAPLLGLGSVPSKFHSTWNLPGDLIWK